MQYSLNGVSTLKFNFDNKKLPNGQFDISPVLKKKINQLNDENFDIELMFSLKDSENKKVPFELELVVVGNYTIKSYTQEDLRNFLNVNAIQILFPYLRSILSSAMASLMIPPIFIPIMDARNIFNDQDDSNQ